MPTFDNIVIDPVELIDGFSAEELFSNTLSQV